ncbi:MAG: patatin-like phospholipase family protein [Spirosomataceae bacterium]
MRILVLSGGSVKGAFQAGAIRALFESGFQPDAIYGVSAGAMNSTFLVNHLGKQYRAKQSYDLNEAANDLCAFWKEKVTNPGSLARRRGTYELGLSALRRNFEGLLDNTPLRELMEGEADIQNLRASPVALKVGTVDIQDGGIVYADPSFDHFFDYVLGSCAIPILMPVVKIGGNATMAFLDGGMRDVAPIKKALRDGATHIAVIACHPRLIHGQPFNYGNLLALVDRAMDITVQEIVNNDIEWAEYLHALLPKDRKWVSEGKLRPYQHFKLTVIRPQKALMVNIQDFSTDDIVHMIERGYHTTKEILKNKTQPPEEE